MSDTPKLDREAARKRCDDIAQEPVYSWTHHSDLAGYLRLALAELDEKDAEIELLRKLVEDIHAGRLRCAWLWDDQFEQVRCWPIDADGFQFGESFATVLEALEAASREQG